MPRKARLMSALELKEKAETPGEYSVGGVSGLFLVVRKSPTGALWTSWMLRRQGASDLAPILTSRLGKLGSLRRMRFRKHVPELIWLRRSGRQWPNTRLERGRSRSPRLPLRFPSILHGRKSGENGRTLRKPVAGSSCESASTSFRTPERFW